LSTISRARSTGRAVPDRHHVEAAATEIGNQAVGIRNARDNALRSKAGFFFTG
jgi:hypothetical protein